MPGRLRNNTANRKVFTNRSENIYRSSCFTRAQSAPVAAGQGRRQIVASCRDSTFTDASFERISSATVIVEPPKVEAVSWYDNIP